MMVNNNNLSIRSRLILWLIIPLTIVSLLTLATMSFFISSKSNALFDQNLLAAAHAVREKLSIKKGKIELQMPYFVLDVMESTSGEKIFYRIQRSDGEILAGFKGLVPPAQKEPSKTPVFYSTQYAGNDLRAVYLPIVAPPSHVKGSNYIIIAESLQGRQSFTDTIVYGLTMVSIVWILLSIICAVLAVNKGLLPLKRIKHSLLTRTVNDLSPLNTQVPKEVQELILSINLLMSRIRESIEHMKHFNADVSHQLRTPLAEIRTLAELAQQDTDRENVKNSLQHIEEVTDFLSRTTQQLLSYAKTNKNLLDDSHLTPLNLNQLCQRVAMKLAPKVYQCGQELAFINTSIDDAQIIGDPIMLEGLLTNLIDNACLYGKALHNKNSTAITIRVGKTANGAYIEIEDQGPGIAHQHIEKVTQRFYRVNKHQNDNKGSGLGLAIAQQICDFHQAKLQLSNVQPQGLKVHILFTM